MDSDRPSSLEIARTGLLAVCEPQRETLRVRGSEARSWLNGLITADLAGIGPKQGAYGLLLNKQGKVQTDLDVLSVEGGLALGVAPGSGEDIRSLLERFLIMEDAEIETAPALAWLRLFGPRAGSIVSELADVPGVISAGAIAWLDGGGAALLVPRPALGEIAADAVRRGGAASRVATAPDWDLLRIAQGFPVFGVDYGPEDNPHEASLEQRAVSFSKGCYLGQEVVCMQDMRGKIKRRVAVLRFDESGPGSEREVLAEGTAEPVGRISSLAENGQTALALARLKAPFFEQGARVRVGGQPAKIVPPLRG